MFCKSDVQIWLHLLVMVPAPGRTISFSQGIHTASFILEPSNIWEGRRVPVIKGTEEITGKAVNTV